MLSEALQRHPEDLDAALLAYNADRLPDIQALLKVNQALAGIRGISLVRPPALSL